MCWFTRRFKYLLIIVLTGLAGCSGEDGKQAVAENLKQQEACWNAGDIPCFMDFYWKSDSLMFIGSRGISYGWQQVLDNYLKNYNTPEKMGTLSFDIKKLDRIGPKAVWVAGSWHLKRDEAGDIGGYFTLLWKYIDGRWVIVADHTS